MKWLYNIASKYGGLSGVNVTYCEFILGVVAGLFSLFILTLVAISVICLLLIGPVILGIYLLGHTIPVQIICIGIGSASSYIMLLLLFVFHYITITYRYLVGKIDCGKIDISKYM